MATLPKLAVLLGALLAVLSLAAAQAAPPTPAAGNCDPLKLAVCADVLDGLVRVTAGLGAIIPGAGGDGGGQCCPVIQGLVDLNVAACLCTAIRARANVLNVVRIDVAPLVVRLLLNRCDRTAPRGFTCPSA